MGGILWSTWRSTRGIEPTYRLLDFRRWSHAGIADMWDEHVKLGIADDGAPTGIEHAFRFESFQPDLVVWWSRWRDRRGAQRFRDLYLAGRDHQPFAQATHDAVFVQGEHPLLARAIELDALHWHAHDATSLIDLVTRWREAAPLRDVAMPLHFPASCRGMTPSRDASAQLAERHAAIAGVERELLAQIEAEPRNEGLLVVYADWLETAGRLDEATAVRARVTST